MKKKRVGRQSGVRKGCYSVFDFIPQGRSTVRDIEVIRSNGLWEFDGLGEAYFSWQECEGCKSDVGGNRYDLVFKYSLDDTEVYTISLCEECMHYIFGDEVDLLEKHTEDISIR